MPVTFDLSLTRPTNQVGNWMSMLPVAMLPVALSASLVDSNLGKAVPVAVSSLQVVLPILDGSQADSPTFQAEWQARMLAAEQQGILWRRHVMDPNALVDTDTIAETVDNVFQMASRFGPSSLDFRGLRAEAVNGEHLAAALRASSSFSHMALGWEDALQVAYDAVLAAGGDPQDALFGMIEG